MFSVVSPCMLLVSCFWQMKACKTRALDRMTTTVLTVTYKMLEASAKCPYNFSTQHFKMSLLSVQTVSLSVTSAFQRTVGTFGSQPCVVAYIFEPVPFRKIM